MASAWGKSWGSAWGNSWGTISTADRIIPPSGGSFGGAIIPFWQQKKKPIAPIDLSGRHVGAHYATGTLQIDIPLSGEHGGQSNLSGLVFLLLTVSGIAQSFHCAKVSAYQLSTWQVANQKKKREEQAVILASIALIKSKKRK